MKGMVREILVSCRSYRVYSQPVLHFKAVIKPEKLGFNYKISMNVMRIDGIPIIYIVHTHTSFHNVTLLCDKKTKEICLAFVER